MQRLEAAFSASLSDFKKSPSSLMAASDGAAVAILNHNRVMAYMVPARVYEAMLDRLDDLELAATARARLSEKGVPVNIDEL